MKFTQTEYNDALQKFSNILLDQQSKTMTTQGEPANTIIGTFSKTGRKFDKIYLSVLRENKKEVLDVKYFVDHIDGGIYAPKSDAAPNLNRYFGNIFNVDKWDWTGEFGKPVNDDSVTLGKSYGTMPHYIKVNV